MQGDVEHYHMQPTYHSTQSFPGERAAGLWEGEWQHPVGQLAPLHQELDSRSCPPYQTPTSENVVDDLGGSTLILGLCLM